MNIYLTLSHAPELRELPREVRRVVVSRALDNLRSRARLFYWLPNLLCLICGVGGPILLGGFVVRLFDHFHLIPNSLNESPAGGLLNIPIAILTGSIAGFIGLQFQNWKLRPLLPKVIANFISEVLRPA
jgi:hypothetical protein